MKPIKDKATSISSVFDAIAVPVVGLDSNLRIVTANSEARRFLTILDQTSSFEAVISKKRGLRKALNLAIETGQESKAKVTLKKEFKTEFMAIIRPIDPADNTNNISLVVTFEDRSSLRDVKAMRSDFVANVSHEIRSPLTAISGFVETLQGSASDDPDAQKLFLTMMEKEVTRMTHLVRDLLSLSQVEVKKRRAPKKIVDVNQIIKQAGESALTFITKHGKTLDVSTSTPLPDVAGNHDDLVRVLINLLENAAVYSRDGGVIQLRAHVENGDNPLGKPAVCVSVSDEGEGIPANEIPRLTERFYRIDKSHSRNVGGTGLGLAIVKHILLRHRGKLEIKSTLGEGSEFRFYLPVKKITE
ncbi:MAG: histidine kinase [Rhodobacteraceae bacterium]|nr:histidine kinase [Paracoccaceae bacterium]